MSSLRNRRNIFLILALSVILLSVLAQSMGARALFDNRIWLEGKSNPALRVFLHGTATQGSQRIDVILVFSTIPSTSDLDELKLLCQLNTFTGHVATVTAPLNSLPSIAALSFVSRIAMPKILKPELDVSVPEILANQVWNTAKYPGVRDSSGRIVNGTGVIIGVADSGIDYLHKDFDFPNGTSKILYIWDQTAIGTPPQGYTYGNECTLADIQAQTCSEFDGGSVTTLTTGHGTAVAAVAASTGQASHKYYGVAPGASIVAVKLIDGAENHVIDAMNYMIKRAHQLGRPIVIVHSLGDSLGSHDGTEPLELAFTDFANEGVPIVVAAGNDRSASLHVDGDLSPGQSLYVPWSMNGNQNQIDLWYPVTNVFSLSVTTPSGQVIEGPTSDTGVSTLSGNVYIESDMRASGREWWISVTGVTPTYSGQWSFTLTSVGGPGGRWDAWTEPGRFTGSNGTLTRLYAIDPSGTIDTPGTAYGVITAGGYETKYSWWGLCTTCMQWEEENGYMGYWWAPYFAPAVGALAYQSSAGPTRDGRIKPDLVAPAGAIAAARASTAPERHSDPDNYHQVWYGTSFAAPHVAGVIALMLQMNPYLTPDEIISILKTDARQDNFTGPIDKLAGSPLWGWGKVNALKSTLDAPSLYSVTIHIQATTIPITVTVTLDGATADRFTLNETAAVTFEFKRGGDHTLALTPLISAGQGVRYVLQAHLWMFSSGGTRAFTYELQYYLQANSEYGNITGTGWYDVNRTAVLEINPTIVGNHQFEGWIGSVVTSSATATIQMDSSKALSATWSPGLPTESQIERSPATLAAEALLVAIVVLVVFLRLRPLRKRPRQRPSADSPPLPS